MEVRRILIADSHEDARESFAELLRFIGHDVTTADCYLAVAQALQPKDVELAFVDSRLRGSTAGALEELAAQASARVVVLSTSWRDGGSAPARHGRVITLRKPASREELASVLAQVESGFAPAPRP